MWSARAATSMHASEASRVLRVISGQIQIAQHFVLEIPYDTSNFYRAEDMGNDNQHQLVSQYEENEGEPSEALALSVPEAPPFDVLLTDIDWVCQSLASFAPVLTMSRALSIVISAATCQMKRHQIIISQLTNACHRTCGRPRGSLTSGHVGCKPCLFRKREAPILRQTGHQPSEL